MRACFCATAARFRSGRLAGRIEADVRDQAERFQECLARFARDNFGRAGPNQLRRASFVFGGSAGSRNQVAWLARDLGGNRQNVQRIINDLQREGLVSFEINPHHRRAQLVVLTENGRRAFEAAMELQAPWINDLSEGLSVKDIRTVHRVITAFETSLRAAVRTSRPEC